MTDCIRHLFYRRMERKLQPVGNDFPGGSTFVGSYNIHFDVNPSTKMSGLLHQVFNFDAGDVYGWPCDNITKEELDRLYDAGQRAFVLNLGYKEVILYDIKLITQDEYLTYNRLTSGLRTRLIELLTDHFDDYGTEQLEDAADDINKLYSDIIKGP
jgi:hypothetical protein